MKKLVSILSVFVFCFGFVYAKGQQGSEVTADEPVTLRFQNWLTSENATRALFEEIAEMFKEEHPNVSIELQAVPYNNMKDQLILASVGGNPPDASQAKTEWIAPLHEGGYVEPLRKYYGSDFFGDFNKAALNGTTFDGEVMALPWVPSPIAVYANKELIAKAGYDPDKKLATWEEVMEVASAIRALGKDENGNELYGWGVSSLKNTGTGYFFLSYIWSYGGSFLQNDKISFNSQGTKDAYQWLQDTINARVTPVGSEIRDLRNLFAQGTLGFYMDGEFGISIGRSLSPLGEDFDDVYYTMPMPVGATGKSETFFVEHDLLIPSGSENKAMAAEFIKFLTGTEAMTHYSANVGGKISP
ncbi:MAG: sugar ABC transporter substrate-binding protein, partial [Spirochaetales bacterium]|nr:sugar ABC transporter substrate-binding protein [Spirochaetales bacterium]